MNASELLEEMRQGGLLISKKEYHPRAYYKKSTIKWWLIKDGRTRPIQYSAIAPLIRRRQIQFSYSDLSWGIQSAYRVQEMVSENND